MGRSSPGPAPSCAAHFDATEVLSTLRDDPSITLFFGVPTMYARLLAEAERQGAPARWLRLFVLHGLCAIDASVINRLIGQGPVIETEIWRARGRPGALGQQDRD